MVHGLRKGGDQMMRSKLIVQTNTQPVARVLFPTTTEATRPPNVSQAMDGGGGMVTSPGIVSGGFTLSMSAAPSALAAAQDWLPLVGGGVGSYNGVGVGGWVAGVQGSGASQMQTLP